MIISSQKDILSVLLLVSLGDDDELSHQGDNEHVLNICMSSPCHQTPCIRNLHCPSPPIPIHPSPSRSCIIAIIHAISIYRYHLIPVSSNKCPMKHVNSTVTRLKINWLLSQACLTP